VQPSWPQRHPPADHAFRHHSKAAGPREPDPRLARLTERETGVLRLIAAGDSNAEIAEQLAISENTVKTHITHILDKLQLRDRVQAVIFAYQAGIVG
jgi:DNA-binding NarL/FixJ family response regulator